MASKILLSIAELSQNLFSIIDIYADEKCKIRLEGVLNELYQIKELVLIKMDNDLNQNSTYIENTRCDESDEDMEIINHLILTEEAIKSDFKTPKLKRSDSMDDDCFLTQACKLESVMSSKKVSVNEEINENQAQNEKYVEILKKYFGHSSFRPLQLQIIRNAIECKTDNLVVMATGQGKSLCYQYPSLYLNGLTVVISPLISLMEDQVLALKMVNVEACFLGSAQEDESNVRKNLFQNLYRVLYITPEYLEIFSDTLVEINDKFGISLVAIDECHCVSQWGSDFRESYRNIGKLLRNRLRNVPFMALTATATPNVRLDIIKSLKLINPTITVTSFDRPNLYISVSLKSDEILKDLKHFLNDEKKFDGSTIIYCPTRKKTIEVVEQLRKMRITCEAYHAGLDLKDRKENQKKFISDQIDCMVATIAFGMGIDKPDIRNVIHYGAPKDLESYYQEIGRAGRDGSPSKCHVFYSTSDFSLASFYLKDVKTEEMRQHKSEMITRMQQFLTTDKCRRRFLLKYFDENEPLLKNNNDSLDCCDNCTRKFYLKKAGYSLEETLIDYTDEAKKLFKTIDLFNQRFGLSLLIKYLIGSRSQQLTSKVSDKNLKHELYNSAKVKNETWWKSFAQQLINDGYIRTKTIQGSISCYSIIELSNSGHDVLTDEGKTVKISETEEMRKSSKHPSMNNPISILPMIAINKIENNILNKIVSKEDQEEMRKEQDLFKILLKVRNDIASDFGISAHKVAFNRILENLAHVRPSKVENLEYIEDFPKEKYSTIGVIFIQTIKDFCKKEALALDNLRYQNDKDEIAFQEKFLDERLNEIYEQLSETKRQTYRIFQIEKKSLKATSEERGFVESTILSHLADAILMGLPIDYERLEVTNETIDYVEEVIRKPPINSNISRLAPIKEQIPDLSYEQLKIIVSLIKFKYGCGPQSTELGELIKEHFNDNSIDHVKVTNKQKELQLNFALKATRSVPKWFKKRSNYNSTYTVNTKITGCLRKKPKFSI